MTHGTLAKPATTGVLDLSKHSLAARLARASRYKAATCIALIGLATVWLAVAGGTQTTTLQIGGLGESLAIGAPVWIFAGSATLLALAALAVCLKSTTSVRGRRAVTVCVVVTVSAALVALIAWAARGDQANLAGILTLSIAASVPIMIGSTSGVLAERSGTFNIAIEGQMLVGAFGSALVGTLTNNLWAGLAVGIVAGFGLGALLAVLTIRFGVSQIVAGFVLDSFATGLTAYLFEEVMAPNSAKFNAPPVFGTWQIPMLAKIPLIGPALFDANPMFYLSIALIIGLTLFLSRTALGLRVRAVGENPAAAQSSGVNPRRLRFWATSVSGAVGGAAGAYFTIGSAGQFVPGMSSGLGYVALAAVILGSWRPAQAAAAGLLFGTATSISAVFGLLKVNIPPSLLLVTPYVITILVVAGVVAVGRGPAAAGHDID